MVGEFFRNWKYSVLQQQNNITGGWEPVVISSNCNCVNSDFQRIKLEDKRLLLSSNSWKCPSRVKLISSWNLIPMWEVCDPEMEEKGLCIFTVFVPTPSRAFLPWKNMPTCTCGTSSTVMADLQQGSLGSQGHFSQHTAHLHWEWWEWGSAELGSPIPSQPTPPNCSSDRCGTEMKQPNKWLRGLTSAEALSLLPCWWTLQAQLFHGIQDFITPGWKELMLLSEAAQKHKTCGSSGKGFQCSTKTNHLFSFSVVLANFFLTVKLSWISSKM